MKESSLSSDVDPEAARKSRERNSSHHGREPVFLQMRRKAESDAEQKSARLKQQRITRAAAAAEAATAAAVPVVAATKVRKTGLADLGSE
jgi:hypothetical protein